MSNITDIFGGEFRINDLPVLPPIEQLSNAMFNDDITPPKDIILEVLQDYISQEIQFKD